MHKANWELLGIGHNKRDDAQPVNHLQRLGSLHFERNAARTGRHIATRWAKPLAGC